MNRPNDTATGDMDAALDLLQHRLSEVRDLVDSVEDDDQRDRYAILVETVDARIAALRTAAARDGVDTADLEDPHGVVYSLLRVVDELRHDLDDEIDTERAASLDTSERRLRQWLGTLDDLRVQATLGRMELDDEIEVLSQRGRRAWNDLVRDLRRASADVVRDADAATADAQLLMADVRETIGKLIRAGGGQ